MNATEPETAPADRLLLVVRAFYAINLVVAFQLASMVWFAGLNNPAMIPLWPVRWIPLAGVERGANLISGLLLTAGVAGMLWTGRRAVRFAVAGATLLGDGFIFSFGAINHVFHIWLWMSLVFAFLSPEIFGARRHEAAVRQSALATFGIAQALVLLFYTLSGFFKLKSCAHVGPMACALAPDALPLLVANRLMQLPGATITGQLVVNHRWLAWLGFLAVLYFEMFAVAIWRRPALHRLWGSCLAVFHIGVWLTLGILFFLQPVQLMLLLVWAPEAPERNDWRRIAAQLPLFGAGWRVLRGEQALLPALRDEVLLLLPLLAVAALVQIGGWTYGALH